MINKVINSIDEAKESLENQEEAMALYRELIRQAYILKNDISDAWRRDHIDYMYNKMLESHEEVCQELQDFETFYNAIMQDFIYDKMHYSSLKKGFNGKLNIYNRDKKGKLTLENMAIGYDKYSSFRDVPFNRYKDNN